MKKIEGIGKTKEKAIESAITSIGVSSLEELEKNYDYKIEVVEEKTKGLFGIFGPKNVKVSIILDEKKNPLLYQDEISKPTSDPDFSPEEFLSNIFKFMGIDARVEVFNREDNELFFKIHSKDRGIVIGKHGETLDAIQYLLNIISSRKGLEKSIYLDLDGYREKRKIYLKRVAKRAASRAISTGKTIPLDPMSTVERRYVHNLLKKDPHITTKSEGREPRRRVVVYPVNVGRGEKNKRV